MNKLILSLIIAIVGVVAYVKAIPSAYSIPNVPYHRQETQYNCGDASLQMVLEYNGRKVDQKQLDDVARTSNKVGTCSYDIVRTPRFSILSSTQGTDEPKHEAQHGFKNYPLGLLSVGYSSATLWLDELKALVAQDFPVIVLMAYLPTDRGGHFRVITGYDDNNQIIMSHDPWDRDGQPRFFNMSYTEFVDLWNYVEPESPRGTPYMGAIMYPLNVESSAELLSGNQTKVTASFSYDNYFPIDNINATLPTGLQALTSIKLPKGVELSQSTELLNSQQSSYTTSSFTQNSKYSFSWIIECDSTNCDGYTYEITTEIIITDSLPYTYFRNGFNFPAYSYIDAVGTTISVTI
ncbi:hypothetical protein DICPUDRAFT_25333 [Dictyostelium purpureum]|uniref:Peptidase C39-like domain-containing protein n=1 Tax=Dictyostelium purpureum TaxID=5786 RepID=F0Z6Q7_DICPU|nr:uncharacterized protein DICPUDRAFT_25333 [Dictyostelium purpureum]EGC40351.1 hypothetical protein DICPUDRAFT_25333 [Dictyostelium purpureum]|eukprot:XP_003283102.1 hypothetical protein DICPUDRAFT_25333 [Dictyostelium purpureum]